MLLMLCETVQPAVAAGQESASAALSARAVAYIASHFHEPIHAADIADALDCNRDYLGRSFMRHRGMTLTEYIQAHRIQLARKMLRESHLSIEQIVKRCGFTCCDCLCLNECHMHSAFGLDIAKS